MMLPSRTLVCLAATLLTASCALRSGDIAAQRVDPLEFIAWDCARLGDELDRVQRRAADVAYAVDQRAGTNIVAMGVGVMVFWPALLALRPQGDDAAALAQLKGRHDAIRVAASRLACPPQAAELPPHRAAAMPVAVGDALVYEETEARTARSRPRELRLQVRSLLRQGIELARVGADGQWQATWQQDLAGNLSGVDHGPGWSQLLVPDLSLGQVLAGQMSEPGGAHARVRLRGQVVALGPRVVAGRRFDAAIVELFGDIELPQQTARLEGALVVDRSSGLLLSLQLRSPVAAFDGERHLVRIEPAAPAR